MLVRKKDLIAGNFAIEIARRNLGKLFIGKRDAVMLDADFRQSKANLGRSAARNRRLIGGNLGVLRGPLILHALGRSGHGGRGEAEGMGK